MTRASRWTTLGAIGLVVAACALGLACLDPSVACPGDVRPIPAAPVYECDAGPPDAGGCLALHSDGGADEPTYPVGCRAYLPQQQGGCAGACCGAQVCYCQEHGAVGSRPGFLCPM